MAARSEQRLRVALDVLEFYSGLKNRVPTADEINLLVSCADGESEVGLALDELACRVIRRELLRERGRQLPIEIGGDTLKQA